MVSSVEERCVLVHDSSISNELVSVLVLIAFRLILHIFQCNWVLYDVLVRWGILLGYLVVENTVPVVVPHFLQYFLENLV